MVGSGWVLSYVEPSLNINRFTDSMKSWKHNSSSEISTLYKLEGNGVCFDHVYNYWLEHAGVTKNNKSTWDK